MNRAVLVYLDGVNSSLSPVVHDDVLPSINTEYNTYCDT